MQVQIEANSGPRHLSHVFTDNRREEERRTTEKAIPLTYAQRRATNSVKTRENRMKWRTPVEAQRGKKKGENGGVPLSH